ncbi:putative pentatricopeptide repeat-containing protein At1g69350, mitochondrial [Andrographis paniculata]|uniref:putative pentatricopeptide repeat-containing protein At1g69350, mitochondrial n=1 Tax=Andrographis paniculata TaxID=175694 RepID=UPI0021E76447|nr:putative pentatricopeptide repeat-containing protein At1g69350, mitochondrial [Andrographis paniculata]
MYMPLFRACTSFRSVSAVHGHLTVTGFGKDRLVATKLIEAYSQTGAVQWSRLIFKTFSNPDSFMWGVVIKCNVWNGFFLEAIDVYRSMLANAVELNNFVFPPILSACSSICDLRTGETIHSTVLKSGFDCDPIVSTSLLNLYGSSECLCSARKVFDEMPERDSVSWSSIITNYIRSGSEAEGLKLFREMVRVEMAIDAVTMLSVSEACGELRMPIIGKSCHGYTVRKNIPIDSALVSSLVAMYGKFGDVNSAERLFGNSVDRSTASWTAMISCYNQNGCYSEALKMFVKMSGHKLEANTVTLMNVVCSCARLRCLREGRAVHAYAVRNYIDLDDDFLRSSLIDLYANGGELRYARLVFDSAYEKDVVSWNILISGYAREHMAEESLSLFREMLVRGILPDSFASASALTACGSIGLSEFGCQIHALVVKTYVVPNEFVRNSLIDMYAKCGFTSSAFRVFCDARDGSSVVAWNSMMCGFLQNGYSEEAVRLFEEMCANNLHVDEVTFLSVVQACSNLGFIDKAKWVHHRLITSGVTSDMYIDTALVNMYARCGDLDVSRRVFDRMRDRSVVTWSSMISCYAMHGRIDDSIALFDGMIESGRRPNDVAFMSILSACGHAGNVSRGKSYFDSMVRDYGIAPSSEHYACLVDMLSRAGDIDGAYEVILSMPFPVDASVWGALVNGCRIHQRMDFLSRIESDLVNVNGDDSGYYALLRNVYAEGGKWVEAMKVKSRMRSQDMTKVHGRSMIEARPS